MIEDNVCIVSGLQSEFVMPVEAQNNYNPDTNDRFIIMKWRISVYGESYMKNGYGATEIVKEPPPELQITSKHRFSNVVQFIDDQDINHAERIYHAINSYNGTI